MLESYFLITQHIKNDPFKKAKKLALSGISLLLVRKVKEDLSIESNCNYVEFTSTEQERHFLRS